MSKNEKKVVLDLTTVDGNAFAIIGAYKQAAKRQGFAKGYIDKVIEEARNADYNHLLITIMEATEAPE